MKSPEQQWKQQQFVNLAMISHEIRTPMNGILGFARLLAETPRYDEDCVQMIISNAEAVLQIVDDILDFACVASGTFKVEAQPFVVRSLVANVWNLLALPAREKGVLFKMDIAPDVPEKLIGDAGRLRQVLINLSSNAMKFTNEGHMTIAVKWNSPHILFCVEDMGKGIPAEKLETIFQPFNGCQKDGGRGLGLAISKKLIELMGSSLHVESQCGIGSKFFFSLLMKSF